MGNRTRRFLGALSDLNGRKAWTVKELEWQAFSLGTTTLWVWGLRLVGFVRYLGSSDITQARTYRLTQKGLDWLAGQGVSMPEEQL